MNHQPPFFLVGCPRSGTTFLQSLIAAHPKISSFPETKFFNNLTPDHPLKKKLGLVARSRIRSTLISFFESIQRPDLVATIPKIPLKAIYINYFMNLLNRLKWEQGKTYLLEKTPEHLYHINEIEQYVPGVKFIHLFRNGTDVVASLYEVTRRYPKIWGGSWAIDRCIDRWIEMIQISLEYLEKPNHCALRYEKVLEDTPACLQRLCQFIDIEYSHSMIENYHQSSGFLINKTSRKVEENIKNVDSTHHKFYSLFTKSEQDYILDRVSPIDLDTIHFL